MTKFTDADLECMFDDWFDENYKPVSFGKLSYPASTVLQRVDPIAYGQLMSDWLDVNYGDLHD